MTFKSRNNNNLRNDTRQNGSEKNNNIDLGASVKSPKDAKSECISTIYKEGANSRRSRCSFRMKKCGSLIWICVFSILVVASTFTTLVIWFTDVFNDTLRSKLAISRNSESFDLWVAPPVESILNVHFFNYTNIDNYLNGKDSKIKVEDIGPYVYRQKMNKYDIHFQNNTVTYRDNRTHIFDAEMSGSLSNNDVVMIPNIPVVVAKSYFKVHGTIKRMAIDVVSRMMGTEDFKSQSVHDILFDYKDFLMILSEVCSVIESCANEFGVVEKFGILEMTEQALREPITVHTGRDNLLNMGKVSAHRYQQSMNVWPTQECNQIRGSEGFQYPPKSVSAHERLEIFVPFYCRTLPLTFEKRVKVFDTYPAVRYLFADDTFSYSDEYPANKCFCDGECPPDGVFNPKPCSKNFTIFISYPHFYKADPVLLEPFEGLYPSKENHESYLDLNERFGFIMGGVSRFQLNLEMKKSDFRGIKRDLIVPICWIEVLPGKIPKDIFQKLNISTFVVSIVELSLKILSALTLVVSSIMLYFNIYHYIKHFKLREFKNFYIVNAKI